MVFGDQPITFPSSVIHMASPINDKAIPGKVQIIPGTNFALATVLESLSLSDSLEWQDLVEKFGNPSDSKIETLSGKGYLSSINRITFIFKNGSRFSVILKVPSAENLKGVDAVEVSEVALNLIHLHNQEVFFYTKISKHFDGLSFGKLLPKVFAAECCQDDKLEKSFILMEDVSARGHHFNFETGKALSYQQVVSILEPLAEFHAHSLSLPKDLINGIGLPSAFKVTFKNDLGSHLKSLPLKIGEYFRTNAKILDKFLISAPLHFNNYYFGLNEKLGLPAVLSHGDLWCNNLLFKSKEDDANISAILDWQFAHPDTGMNDVVHLLLTSVEGGLRRKHEDEWLQFYFACFQRTLASGIESPFKDLDHLKVVYRSHFYPELLVQMVNLTTFLASNDNDPARRAECGRMINAFEQLMVEVTEEATSTVSNSSCTNGTILLN